MTALLERIRPTPWRALALATLTYATVLLLANLVIHGPAGRAIVNIEKATDGWVAVQLVLPLATLWAVSFAVFGIGRLRCADVGWRVSAVIPALLVTSLFWLAVQASLLLVVVLGGDELTLDPRWHGRWGAAFAPLVVQLIGNALLEETFFRGYLLQQMWLRASGVSARCVGSTAAVIVSSGLFALSHWPRLLAQSVPAAMADELSWMFLFGLTLALVFLVTRNLFLCVGLHSLFNAPLPLTEVPRPSVELVWWVWTILLILAWCIARGIGAARRAAELRV